MCRIFVGCLVLLAATRGSAAEVSPLHLLVSTPIIGTLYVPPPKNPAMDLLLTGEAPVVQLDVSILNDSDETRILNVPGRRLTAVVRTYPDGLNVELPEPSVGAPVRVFGTGETNASWDPQMSLGPHERLKWAMQLNLVSAAPGIYSIEVVLPGTDDRGTDIARWAPVVYLEIREDSSEQAANEIAIRAPIRLAAANHLREALDAATTAAANFPNSVAAHAILADLYEKLGRRGDASRSYSRALAALEAGADRPFRADQPPEARQRALYLRSKIAQLR